MEPDNFDEFSDDASSEDFFADRELGRDFHDDGEGETFTPPPHQDDRLWRHPSEMMAAQAASASSPTISAERGRSGRQHRAALVLAGVASLALIAGGAQLQRSDGNVPVSIGAVAPANASTTSATGTSPDTTSDITSDNISNSSSDITSDITVAVADPRGDAAHSWVRALRTRIDPQMPQISAIDNDGVRHGYGLFVDPSGLVLTSASLIDGADALLVHTEAGARYPAVVIGHDRQSDIALIDIEGDSHPVADLAITSQLRVGQHTLGVTSSNSTGMEVGEVLYLAGNRQLLSGDTLYGTAELDLPAEELMPGSAVFNDTGSVIGIVPGTEPSAENAAIIPISVAQRVGEDLQTHGASQQAWLGLDLHDVAAPPALDALGFDSTAGTAVQVVGVHPDGPADVAGLAQGDHLLSLDGRRISRSADVISVLTAHAPGTLILAELERNGIRIVTDVETGLFSE